MNIEALQLAVEEFGIDLHTAITTAQFRGSTYEHGHKAKEALIRSQRLINKIHEVVKSGIVDELKSKKVPYSIHPEVGSSSPELTISGFLKAKKQDVVALFGKRERELIATGVLAGTYDNVGFNTSEGSIVIGVRSQMSSIDNNFDTLMERAFAETLNLRLRLPRLVMGEVYMLPVYEFDDDHMLRNIVKFKGTPVKIEKFIKTFLAISSRNIEKEELFKYERSALILVDFSKDKPKLLLTGDDIKEYIKDSFVDELRSMEKQGVISSFGDDFFSALSPVNFCKDIVDLHTHRHL